MGTVITLDVDGLTLDWAKNGRGDNHGFLFQDNDRKLLPNEGGFDVGDNSVEYACDDMEMGFSKNLSDVVPRLELLGFGVERIEQEYCAVADACCEQRRSLSRHGIEEPLDIMTFREFLEFVVMYPINELDNRCVDGISGDCDRSVGGRFSKNSELLRIPDSLYDYGSYSELSFFGDLIRVLHPYSILRLLAENEENRSCNVNWRYGSLVEAGWARNSEFVPNARRTQTFLIVTEGSSDTYILRHAFSLIRPEVADFFRFIDMDDGHPFPGAGNLVKFARGLSKMDVHNQVVFLLDNDCEGIEARVRLEDVFLRPNMRIVMLPEIDELRSIAARGPDGIKTADINGRAASIECYLDLTAPGIPDAQVVWTTYKRQLEAYQGKLQSKEAYTRAFLKVDSASVQRAEYDVSKISAVLDEILRSCSSIATATRCARSTSIPWG